MTGDKALNLAKLWVAAWNAHDIHKGGEPETFWVLKLDFPICVDQDTAGPDLNPAQEKIRGVQLLLNKEADERARSCRVSEFRQPEAAPEASAPRTAEGGCPHISFNRYFCAAAALSFW